MCEWTLSTWGHTALHFELLTALFYIYCPYSLINIHETLVRKSDWSARLIADSPQSQCLLMLIHAIEEIPAAHSLTVKKDMQKAVDLTMQFLPNTFIAACSRLFLIGFYESGDEKALTEIQLAYMRLRCFHFAFCLLASDMDLMIYLIESTYQSRRSYRR